MTTVDESSYDQALAEILQINQSEYHLYAPLTNKVQSRHAQVHGGVQLAQHLNQAGTSRIEMDLPVDKDEAIIMGSMKFQTSLVLECIDVNNRVVDWSNANGAADDDQFVLVNNVATGPVSVPPFIMASQFTMFDIEVAGVSLNAHLPMTCQSEEGCAPVAISNHYFNAPENCGAYKINDTGCTDIYHRHSLASENGNTEIRLQERVYHQLLQPVNMLMAKDQGDHEHLKVLPRGMPIKLNTNTKPRADRTILYTSHDGAKRLRARFVDVKLEYQVVTIPEEHKQNEPEKLNYATMDTAVRVFPLTAGQTKAIAQITYTDRSYVPHMMAVYTGPADMYEPYRYTASHSVVQPTDRVRRVRATLNGNQNPDFMALYQDYEIDLSDPAKLTTMFQSFQGNIGGNGLRQAWNSFAEKDVISHVRAVTHLSTVCAIIVTDPSVQLFRSASSGVTIGALDLHVTLEGVANNERLYVALFNKQHIAFNKLSERHGSAPRYEVDLLRTQPAFVTAE